MLYSAFLFFFGVRGQLHPRCCCRAGVSSTVGRYGVEPVLGCGCLGVVVCSRRFTSTRHEMCYNFTRVCSRAQGRADDVLTAATAALSWPLSRAAFWGRLRVRRLEGQVLRGRVCCAWQVVSSLNGPRPVSCSALLARERACRWIVT